MALFSIRTNSILRPPPSWIISNGHIYATAHDLLCDSTAFLFTLTLFMQFYSQSELKVNTQLYRAA